MTTSQSENIYPSKGVYFSNQPNIYWSDSFQRWLCFDKTLIDQILNDDTFRVHDFDIDQLTSRFNLDLKISSEILKLFPLAHEGDIHQELRKKFTIEINKNQKNALEVFKNEIQLVVQKIKNDCVNKEIDLIDSIHTAIKKSNAVIAGMSQLSNLNFSDLSRVLDDKTSIKKRVEINNYLVEVLDEMSSEIPYQDKIFRLATLAVGSSSLLGSLSDSLLLILRCTPKGRFTNLSFDFDLPASGVSLLERVANKDISISNIKILKDQKIQLYIESSGYQNNPMPQYSTTYFAAPTRHVCPGMKYSLDMWRILSEAISSLDVSYELIDFNYRTGDSVFNFPTSIRVKID